MRWNLTASYLDLPPPFYTVQDPSPVADPRLVLFNHDLAQTLGLGELAEADLAVLAGQRSLPGTRPFAQAYAGHQYAHFTMLGDGRALVLGEHRTPEGRLVDLQLKGSGPTPYSRSGDGRAALGPMLREYVISEAMAALGIPTTRSLAVVETGETVWRETALPGAVLTRVAASHLRVGTVEFAAAMGDEGALRSLVDYALARHYPAATGPSPAAALLAAVVASQARLVAQWMAVGFVHGVMNTDNVALSGETIDYGPCAFLDSFHRGQVFSSIDRRGRYAYGNQPGITQWNLTRLAEALLPVIDTDPDRAVGLAQTLIDGFATLYQSHYDALMTAKLGLEYHGEDDRSLIEDLLEWMEETGADYTLTFRRLTEGRAWAEEGVGPEGWYEKWKTRLTAEAPQTAQRRMAESNPVYIPRNHRVEEALAAAQEGDLSPVLNLLEVLRQPFTRRSGLEAYEAPPSLEEAAQPYVTFCGT